MSLLNTKNFNKILYLASYENVRFKSGIYTVAQSIIKKNQDFQQFGFKFFPLSTCQIKNRKVQNLGKWNILNVFNSLVVLRKIFQYQWKNKCNIWYVNTSTGLGFVKDVSVVAIAHVFFPKTKKILHIHFADFDVVVPKNKVFKNLYLKMVNRTFYSLILLGEDMKLRFQPHFDNDIFVLPNFYIEKSSLPNKVKKSKNNNLKLLYLSMISTRKGFHILLDLLRILKSENIELHVAGDFLDKSYKSEVLNFIMKYELQSKVKFYGFLENDIKDDLLNNCDVFILLSDGEGMSMSLLEAMSHGLALLISDIESHKVVVGNHIPVFQLSNLEAMKNHLLKLHHDNAFLITQKKYALKESKNFSFDHHFSQLCKILNDTIQ